MPYNKETKDSIGRTKLTNYSVPDPNPASEGGNINVPRVLFYDNGVRSVPIMHRAFKNLEEKYVSTLVAAACAYGDRAAGNLRVLDIGYGLGYSTQKFFELGVGTYHCLEINDSIYWNDAINHNFGLIAMPEDYEMIYNSWEDYADNYEIERPDPNAADAEEPRNPGYDIIYYSPCDDLGNMGLFTKLRRVSKKGAVLGIQGIPLFGGVSVGNFVVSSPSGTAPDSNTYDSNFTVGMYNALNNKGYFSVYYQYYNCQSGAGGIDGLLPGETSCGNEGTWQTSPPSSTGGPRG